MNNERTIVLENVSSQSIGLKDTQNRTYRLSVGAKVRISQASLQDILDYPASKIIFNEGLVKVSNVSAEVLYGMGLSEAEIKKFSLDDYTAVVVTENIDEQKEETIIEVKKPTTKSTTAKKTTAKKTTTTTKKASTSKTK